MLAILWREAILGFQSHTILKEIMPLQYYFNTSLVMYVMQILLLSEETDNFLDNL